MVISGGSIIALILLTVGLFFFVWKMPKNLGIYFGGIPSLVFLLMAIFNNVNYLIVLAIVLTVYIVATTIRINNNKKLKAMQDNKLKEIDKMSINDL